MEELRPADVSIMFWLALCKYFHSPTLKTVPIVKFLVANINLSACDNFTNNTPNQLCFAATFHPGTAKGANNCELFTNALNGETAIIPIDSNGVESVVVTRTKVTNIQS